MVPLHNHSEFDLRWASGVGVVEPPPTASVDNSPVALIDIEERNSIKGCNLQALKNYDWEALAMQAGVVYVNGTRLDFSPLRDLVQIVMHSGDRQLIQLLAQFFVAMRINAVERVAYLTLLRHWQRTRYHAFVERVINPYENHDVVPLPIHARPQPPTAPLAPPALLTAS